MKTTLDCFPCFLRQALQTARFAGAGEGCQRRIIDLALEQLRGAPLGGSPLAIASEVFGMVVRETGVADPYRSAKDACNAEALRWLPTLRERLGSAADQLGFAFKAAVVGNIMDYGALARFDLSELIEQLHQREFQIDDRQDLETRLASARSLSYFADNAGEIVFDRLLIEQLVARFPIERVRLVVRSEPFLNDACEAEARAAGIADLPGVELLAVPVSPLGLDPALMTRATDSDVIIAKGMANFENYSERADFHFLFIAKCELIARMLGDWSGRTISPGDWILHRRGTRFVRTPSSHSHSRSARRRGCAGRRPGRWRRRG